MKRSKAIRIAAQVIALVGALAVTGVGVFYFHTFKGDLSPEPHDWEAFGAYMGGAAGTIIGLATLCTLAFTWAEQARDVEISRAEAEESKYAQHRQIFDSTFFNLLQRFSAIENGIELLGVEDGLRLSGKSAIGYLYGHMQYPVDVPWDNTPAVLEAITEMHSLVYNRYEEELGPYFRTLYHTFKFVDRDSLLTEEDRIEYANIARAQLSRSELLLIFYNCLTPYGVEFKTLIEKYGILKHLRIDQLKDMRHANNPGLYRPTAFMNADQRRAYWAGMADQVL